VFRLQTFYYPAPPDAQAHAQEAHAQAQAQLAQAQTHPPLLTGARSDEALVSPEGVTGIRLFEKASTLVTILPTVDSMVVTAAFANRTAGSDFAVTGFPSTPRSLEGA